jgi:hypothetical protein
VHPGRHDTQAAAAAAAAAFCTNALLVKGSKDVVSGSNASLSMKESIPVASGQKFKWDATWARAILPISITTAPSSFDRSFSYFFIFTEFMVRTRGPQHNFFVSIHDPAVIFEVVLILIWVKTVAGQNSAQI